MPRVLKGRATLPWRSRAMKPPSPPIAATAARTAAAASAGPAAARRRRAESSWAAATRMKLSPWPVADMAQYWSAQVPAPATGVSPMRPGSFAGHAAGAGGGGKVAVGVEGDGADGAVAVGVVGVAATALARKMSRACAAFVGGEVVGGSKGSALGAEEVEGAGAGEEDVGRALHDEAGGLDRVAGAEDAGDGAERGRCAVHDGGVHFRGCRRR